MTVLGHELFGTGATRVAIMNDWLCDTSTWDAVRPYLDTTRFTYAFADLRGYGRSRDRAGTFTLVEAAGDLLALADALGWARFAIVGHSMSTLVALHLAQQDPERIARAVVIAPVPPGGLGVDPAQLAAAQALARADDVTRLAYFAQRPAPRAPAGWAPYKVARWRATTAPEAAAAYVAMFGRDGLPDRTTRIAVPVLAITGERDAPPFRSDAAAAGLEPLCDQLAIEPFEDAGHYPMQEMPPATVALVEGFVG